MTNKARWLSMFALVATVGAVPACASGGVIYRGDGYGAYDAHGGYRRDVERIAHQNGTTRVVKPASRMPAAAVRSPSIVTVIGAMPTRAIAASTAIASSIATNSARDSKPDTPPATTG